MMIFLSSENSGELKTLFICFMMYVFFFFFVFFLNRNTVKNIQYLMLSRLGEKLSR